MGRVSTDVIRWPPGPEADYQSYVHLQWAHDAACHSDVATSSRSYQFRHSMKHLDKVVGLMATYCEQSFHGEDTDALRSDLARRRIPDAQAFVLKVIGLTGAQPNELFSWTQDEHCLRVGQSQAPRPKRAEAAYARLRATVAAVAGDYEARMNNAWLPEGGEVTPDMLVDLQDAVFGIANLFALDLESAYYTRIEGVRKAKGMSG